MSNKKTEDAVTIKEEKMPALPQEYFKDNANVGLSSLTAEDVPVPGLTIIQSGSKLRDDDGRPYAPGVFYYKALKVTYSVVECSILVITKKELPSYEDRNKPERTYLVLGALEPGFMPFVLYAKSSAYFAVRNFIGQIKARKYPMYTLKVQISTELRQNELGEWYVPVFNIVGLRDNTEEIMMLENLAKEYDTAPEGIRSEDEEVATTPAVNQMGHEPEPPVTDEDLANIPF